jgi:hypothetical protein
MFMWMHGSSHRAVRGSAPRNRNLRLDGPHTAVLVQGDDQVGAIARPHHRLGAARVDAYATSGVTDGRGNFGHILFMRPEDAERAVQALRDQATGPRHGPLVACTRQGVRPAQRTAPPDSKRMRTARRENLHLANLWRRFTVLREGLRVRLSARCTADGFDWVRGHDRPAARPVLRAREPSPGYRPREVDPGCEKHAAPFVPAEKPLHLPPPDADVIVRDEVPLDSGMRRCSFCRTSGPGRCDD